MDFLDNFDRIFGEIIIDELEEEEEYFDLEEEDDDNDEINLEISRRPYRRFPRIDFIEMWKDDEFFSRFRMGKGTIVYVLSLIDEQLKPKLYSNR